MAEKKKTPTVVTPRGIAVYPHLKTPDTKFDKDGVYTIKLRLPREDKAAQAFIADLDKRYKSAFELEEAKAWKKKNPKKQLKEASLPYSEDEDTDSYVINFKMKAAFTKDDGTVVPMRPALFDAKRKPLPKGTDVWGGSEVKVAFQPNPFFTAALGVGLNMRLTGVQVLVLKSGSGQSAESMGFEEEDGFSGEEGTEPTEGDDSSDDSDTSGDTDGDSDGDDSSSGDAAGDEDF